VIFPLGNASFISGVIKAAGGSDSEASTKRAIRRLLIYISSRVVGKTTLLELIEAPMYMYFMGTVEDRKILSITVDLPEPSAPTTAMVPSFVLLLCLQYLASMCCGLS
jgi:hypothetical protein